MINHLTILSVYNSASKEEQEKFLKEIGVGTPTPKSKTSQQAKIDYYKSLILKGGNSRNKNK